MEIPEFTLSNGVGIPAVGLGTHLLHGKSLANIISESLDLGIRLIDTAWYYHNEKETARIIRRSGADRERLFITSKVTGAQLYGRKRYFHLFKRNVRQAYEDSCRRLKTDYLDLFLLHSWQFKDDEYEQLLELYDKGMVRAIGVTQATADRLQSLKEKFGMLPHVNEIHVQPLLTKARTLEYSKRNGVQSQVISAIKGRDGRLFQNPVILNIAKRHNVGIRQVIYRWLFQQDLCYLTRTGNPEHLKSNIDIFRFALSDREMYDISSLNCGISFVPYEFEGTLSEVCHSKM